MNAGTLAALITAALGLMAAGASWLNAQAAHQRINDAQAARLAQAAEARPARSADLSQYRPTGRTIE